MWSSIENWKENLNKIALDVHDDDDDDDVTFPINGSDSPYTDRRRSHSLAHSNSSSASPLSNGVIHSPYLSEIERCKAEIKRLKESEAEIKALSVNYASLLKEREENMARLSKENGSLKQTLEDTNAALSSLRSDTSKISANTLSGPRGGGEKSPNRQHKAVNLTRNRSTGNQWQNGVKQDGHSNGFVNGIQMDPTSKISSSREKELADMLEEKNRLLAVLQNDHALQIKSLKMELEKEHKALANTEVQLQDKQKMSNSLAEELNAMKSDLNKVTELRKELDDKTSEIKRLQEKLSRIDKGSYDTDNWTREIARLEKENAKLKVEKEKLGAALKDTSGSWKKPPSNMAESVHAASFPGKDDLEQSLGKVEKDLKETRRERDKAKQELARLKQHLLDKELEESEKMDEDGKIIEELRHHVEYQKATISNLERALQQARASHEEVRTMNDHELQKSKETIEDLKKKIASFMSTIDAKNTELLNLQTALGQYYAEIEAKEHLEGDLSVAREQCSKLEQLLQESKQHVGTSNKEKEELLAKLLGADKMVEEWKSRASKLEEDNAKLRRALEQSMTRLNRMSVESDFLVDRRIVIKLLVTYFQKNHSKEVLDLMVRMLGFSEEDKQRIGVAQHGSGKGVVRGVLGLPGRLVGGIIGGGSPGASTNMASDNQSFADQWVDFLLKESEEREKLESMGVNGGADSSKPSAPVATLPLPERRSGASGRPPIASSTTPSLDTSRSLYSYQSTRQYDTGSAEFSTVPLTPSGKQFS